MTLGPEFAQRKCKPCEGGAKPLEEAAIREALSRLDGWKYEGGSITKTFAFKNYYETVSFVNSAAWIAHREDHHPDVTFGYKSCTVRYSTHAVKGISENDFICAAKVDALLK
jgi:4a-hydroxytetrahydrobiopterin dehydratase